MISISLLVHLAFGGLVLDPAFLAGPHDRAVGAPAAPDPADGPPAPRTEPGLEPGAAGPPVEPAPAAERGPSPAPAATESPPRPRWLLLPLVTAGVDAATAETFRGILAAELTPPTGTELVVGEGGEGCRDARCGRAAGAEAGADVAIFGSLGTLGRKVVVSVGAVEVADGTIRSSSRLTAAGPEELDRIAARFAAAIAAGEPADRAPELGELTEAEVEVDLRREGARGVGLRAGGTYPVAGFGDAAGVTLDLSYWFETADFAIEPRLGLSFDAGADGADFFAMPFDVGAYRLFGRGDVAPFAGGGAGVRWLWVEVPDRELVGRVFVLEQEVRRSDSGWAPVLFVRGGAMLLRTYAVRLSVAAGFTVSIQQLHGEYPQAFDLGLTVLL